MTYPYEYSDKEKSLIEALKYQDVASSPSMPPPLLYNVMAVECFRHNRQDKVAESVRRCLLATEEATRKDGKKILRLTPEFDSLIDIETKFNITVQSIALTLGKSKIPIWEEIHYKNVINKELADKEVQSILDLEMKCFDTIFKGTYRSLYGQENIDRQIKEFKYSIGQFYYIQVEELP